MFYKKEFYILDYIDDGGVVEAIITTPLLNRLGDYSIRVFFSGINNLRDDSNYKHLQAMAYVTRDQKDREVFADIHISSNNSVRTGHGVFRLESSVQAPVLDMIDRLEQIADFSSQEV
jgi:hypothetical protein